MGKESNTLVQLSNKNDAEINGFYSNINPIQFHIPDNLINEKNQFIPKNFVLNGNYNLLNKTQLNSNNKLYEKPNQQINSYTHLEQKSTRKNSSGSETSCDSKHGKKAFIKGNKNKAPFKGEAKDFKIKYKTELCKNFEANGYCKYGDKCAYAHGINNLRSKVTNTTDYRTKKCSKFFEQGYCPYGSRCQFAHQLKSNITNNPYDRGMTYSKILETISKIENVENIKKLIEKPRLPVFQTICENKENCKSRLLEDIKSLNHSRLINRQNHYN